MAAERDLRWAEFTAAIAEVARVPADAIAPGTRLIGDLGLDSLALAELVVLLLTEIGVPSLEDELAGREWEQATVGELFAEYQRGDRPPRGSQFVNRQRPSR
jgi:acyl carrier protein